MKVYRKALALLGVLAAIVGSVAYGAHWYAGYTIDQALEFLQGRYPDFVIDYKSHSISPIAAEISVFDVTVSDQEGNAVQNFGEVIFRECELGSSLPMYCDIEVKDIIFKNLDEFKHFPEIDGKLPLPTSGRTKYDFRDPEHSSISISGEVEGLGHLHVGFSDLKGYDFLRLNKLEKELVEAYKGRDPSEDPTQLTEDPVIKASEHAALTVLSEVCYSRFEFAVSLEPKISERFREDHELLGIYFFGNGPSVSSFMENPTDVELQISFPDQCLKFTNVETPEDLTRDMKAQLTLNGEPVEGYEAHLKNGIHEFLTAELIRQIRTMFWQQSLSQ